METLDGNQTIPSQKQIPVTIKPDVLDETNELGQESMNNTRIGLDETTTNQLDNRPMNTQTRNDLQDLARNYQNYAADDSGLNTLIRVRGDKYFSILFCCCCLILGLMYTYLTVVS